MTTNADTPATLLDQAKRAVERVDRYCTDIQSDIDARNDPNELYTDAPRAEMEALRVGTLPLMRAMYNNAQRTHDKACAERLLKHIINVARQVVE